MSVDKTTPVDIVEETPGRWYAEVYVGNWTSPIVYFRAKAERLAREYCSQNGLAIVDLRIDRYE